MGPSEDEHEQRATARRTRFVLVLMAGYALGAAATTPFTWGSNVMVAIPIVVVTVLAMVFWPAHPDRRVKKLDEAPHHPYLGWLVLLVVVVAWELVEYLARGGRGAHPTLSSMADASDRHYVAKAAAMFAWLWLGIAIVRTGMPTASGPGPPAAGGAPGAQRAQGAQGAAEAEGAEPS